MTTEKAVKKAMSETSGSSATVRINYTPLLLLAAVLLYALPGALSEQEPLKLLQLGLISYVVFLFSLTCHEAAHSLAALLGGDPTAARRGQVTLNPIPHIKREPHGMMIFPLASFLLSHAMIGWASAPFNPAWQLRFPRRAAFMALAGPAANLALMLLAGAAIRIGGSLGYFEPAYPATFSHIAALSSNGGSDLFTTALSILFVLNLLLGVFNLLPIPPLDGSSVIPIFLPDSASRRYLKGIRSGRFRLAGLVIAFLLFNEAFPSIFHEAVALLYTGWV